jgi:hypothetical protein
MVNENKIGAISEGDSAGSNAPSRALVVISQPPGEASRNGTTVRPLSSFLAQLIATRHQAPQTRIRRRAGAGDAANAYGARLSVRARHDRGSASWSI